MEKSQLLNRLSELQTMEQQLTQSALLIKGSIQDVNYWLQKLEGVEGEKPKRKTRLTKKPTKGEDKGDD